MNRKKILEAIKKKQPALLPLPIIDLDEFNDDLDYVATFKQSVVTVGGSVHEVATLTEVTDILQNQFSAIEQKLSLVPGIELTNINLSELATAKELENLGLLILPARFGVAENGAVWMQESDYDRRVLPFIAAHLAVVLKKQDIVENMHQAYIRIDVTSDGYGVFIAGPSKTADIEQSLVVGAHGPLSLSLFLLE